MMRDRRIWGDDADVFKPERFLAEYNPKVDELPDVESLPFGFGRRYENYIKDASHSDLFV
jgi:cytochrome P450